MQGGLLDRAAPRREVRLRADPSMPLLIACVYSCKAVFVDTDTVPALESRVGDLTQNTTEAELVASFVDVLTRSGVAPRQIGVLSLYRQQIKLLSYLLRGHKGVEILTADRSQGRDKDVIVISMVRSNGEGQVSHLVLFRVMECTFLTFQQIGDLLKDWRRINVSFTRARCKLVIVGSRKTLSSTPLLEEFFKLMDERRWILALPPGADTLHEEFLASNTASEPAKSFSTPLKRPAEEDGANGEYKDRKSPNVKRARKRGISEEAIVRGRPILQDLLNDAQ